LQNLFFCTTGINHENAQKFRSLKCRFCVISHLTRLPFFICHVWRIWTQRSWLHCEL